MDNTIKVKVVKPFKAVRTPCPPKGTIGELYDFEDEFACVRFPLPMIDTLGGIWMSEGDDKEYIKLMFYLDEIELV